MQTRGWVWLRDANDSPITPDDLPAQLGLAGFGNDPYRGAVYFARDIGYQQLPEIAAFQEFYWGRWMRESGNVALDPSAYDLNSLSQYLALTKVIAEGMVAFADSDLVTGDKTALDVGKLPAFNTSEFTKLSKAFSASKPGKIAYALDYRLNP
jgi:hypothetical protein